MKTSCLRIEGLVVIEPQIFSDSRGYFFESYRLPRYVEAGIDANFVQDNLSFSKRGSVRGLHYQPGQAKLVSVLVGAIWDVAVDLRAGSPTFGQWEGVELDDQTRRQMFIPDGFAHGFCILSETALVQYKVTAIYDPKAERSIRWNDPHLAVEWPVSEPILSARDQSSPFFEEIFT